jgi:hypothetical protein
MKHFYFLILPFVISVASAQDFDLKDLVGYTELSVQKFDAHIAKKSFKRDYFSPKENANSYTYFQTKKSKRGEAVKTISHQSVKDKTVVCYQTSSAGENANLKEQIRKAGFVHYSGRIKSNDKPLLFQKANFTITTSVEIKDSTSLYTVIVERKELPKAKEVVYAEDLAHFSSHEYLTAAFGERNVVKDVFYYSEKETNKCSVLFPNTNREVIFIWGDEDNYRTINFMMIGGGLLTKKSSDINHTIEHNVWRSNQGIYSGMSLQELQDLNGADLNFYGWHLEQAGMLAPRNSGHIDFKRVGIVLNCLNCSDRSFKSVNIVKSSEQLAEDRKIYVSTLIVIPEKEETAPATATAILTY